MHARRLVGLLAIVALLLASCGDGSEEPDQARQTPTRTEPTTAGTPTVPVGTQIDVAGRTANYHGFEDVSGAREIAIEMADNYFTPTVLRGEPGQKLTVTLRNDTESPHHFTTADQQLIVEVQPGLTAEGQITLPASGNLSFYCLIHAEDGMAGGFNVSGPIGEPDPAASPTSSPTSSPTGSPANSPASR